MKMRQLLQALALKHEAGQAKSTDGSTCIMTIEGPKGLMSIDLCSMIG
jgi:hypothetical protein